VGAFSVNLYQDFTFIQFYTDHVLGAAMPSSFFVTKARIGRLSLFDETMERATLRETKPRQATSNIPLTHFPNPIYRTSCPTHQDSRTRWISQAPVGKPESVQKTMSHATENPNCYKFDNCSPTSEASSDPGSHVSKTSSKVDSYRCGTAYP
jgi:hypothetical protein